VTTSRHPASLSDENLGKLVQVRFKRDRGPGGQHRNKVETGVVAKHTPSGIEASATERRSQADNRKVALFRLRLELALQLREPIDSNPTDLWNGRLRGARIQVSALHNDFPSLLAEAMDTLEHFDWNLPAAAEFLGTSSSQLVKFLKQEPRAFLFLNAQRAERGLRPQR
jgi:hypothetical protein